jgi:hypothetical protein
MNARTPDFEVQITAASSTAHYTEPFDAPDKLAVMLVVENSTANSGTVTVTPQHSNDDGVNWIDKSNLSLSVSAVGANSVQPMFGADDGTVPSMRSMRLKLSVAGAGCFPNIKGYISERTY